MKQWLYFLPIVIASCYFSKTVDSFARKKNMSVREVGGLNLFSGTREIISELPSKKTVLYLVYSGDSLVYLSTERNIFNGDLIYRVQKVGDSIYMLTRSSQLRYLTVDTMLFHNDYVVSNRILYGRGVVEDKEIVQAYFSSYHFSQDSLLKFSYRASRPLISIYQYGADSAATRIFLETKAKLDRLPKVRKEDFISTVVR